LQPDDVHACRRLVAGFIIAVPAESMLCQSEAQSMLSDKALLSFIITALKPELKGLFNALVCFDSRWTINVTGIIEAGRLFYCL
jgi:hypothetical protein